MNITKRIYQSDEQGIVHVDVLVGHSGRRVEVLVVWEELTDAAHPEEPAMADLVGLLQHGDLERPSQGPYENRDLLA